MITPPTAEPSGFAPKLAFILAHRRAAVSARQHVALPRPLGELKAIMLQHRVDEADARLTFAPLGVRLGCGRLTLGPVELPLKHAAQTAHRAPFQMECAAPIAASARGARRRKSSAISS